MNVCFMLVEIKESDSAPTHSLLLNIHNDSIRFNYKKIFKSLGSMVADALN